MATANILQQLIAQRNRINAEQIRLGAELVKINAAIQALQGKPAPVAGAAAKPVKKRKMSAAARAKIAAYQKARWAKIKAGKK